MYVYAISSANVRVGGGGGEFYQRILGGWHETPDGFRVNVEGP